MLEITKDSHTDHALNAGVIKYIEQRFADREAFFVETFELPAKAGTVECSLVGPVLGYDPIPESMVDYVVRGDRKYASRVVEWGEKERTRLVTVIAGPHDGRPCVLYTAYGGPRAPREPGDPAIASWEELEASRKFWSVHALIATPAGRPRHEPEEW